MSKLAARSVGALATIWLVLCAAHAFADFNDATQCPGGNNARSDIVQCFTFDQDLAKCVTGKEALCQAANGYSKLLNPNYSIRHGADAAVGAGYLRMTPGYGSSGTYVENDLVGSQREFAVRYYVRFGPGYMDSSANVHAFRAIVYHGTGPCAAALTVDMDQRTTSGVAKSTCDVSKFTLWGDQLHNGRWYLIEFYGRMESACTDATKLEGCNGYFSAYLDGVKKYENSNFNFAGGSKTAFFGGVLLPATYFHMGFPKWQPPMDWDNIVIGVDASKRIGPAVGAAPATAGINRNYHMSAGADPFIHLRSAGTISLRPEEDCSERALAIGFVSEYAHGAFTLDDVLNVGEVDWLGHTSCNYGAPAVDGSLRLTVTPASATDSSFMLSNPPINNGALSDIGMDSFTGGYIYLHNGNVYTGTPILGGHVSSGHGSCKFTFCQWVGLTIDASGRWALGELNLNNSPTATVIGSGSQQATTEAWHSFEVGIFRNGRADLWIDGVLVISQAQMQVPPGGNTNNGFFGVSQLKDRSKTFSVNFDEPYWSNVSREKCYGDWGSDCPAAILGTHRPTPAVRPLAPTGIR